MAPTKEQRDSFNQFRSRLVNIRHSLPKIGSLDALMDAKDVYINWVISLEAFLESGLYRGHGSGLFLHDEVIEHSKSGGSGLFFGDDRSTDLLAALTAECQKKIIHLDNLFMVTHISRIINKDGTSFTYCSEPITLTKNSHPYHLLDVVYHFCDSDRFISYDKILCEFKKRKKVGSLVGKRIDRKMISNAQTELFSRVRLEKSGRELPKQAPSGILLLDSRKGKGLIFNNETIS